jgi:hypothetical protein
LASVGLDFKGEIGLTDITEADDNESGQYFGKRRVKIQTLYEKFQK